jgi:hypothetical protein
VVGANLGRNLVIAAKVWPWSLKLLEHDKRNSLHREISICNSRENIAKYLQAISVGSGLFTI